MSNVGTVEELTVRYEEDGVLTVQELDKAVLSKGAWATVLFRYRQWEAAKNAYSGDRYSMRRYHKINGAYRAQSRFNISSREQAEKIVETLQTWLALEE
jgi:hypothetical protein